MPIRIFHDSEMGVSRPVITCDHCQKRITNKDDGNYAFPLRVYDLGGCTDPIFLHKKCSWGAEYSQLGMEELARFTQYLDMNMTPQD